jgi:hypothetical protein
MVTYINERKNEAQICLQGYWRSDLLHFDWRSRYSNATRLTFKDPRDLGRHAGRPKSFMEETTVLSLMQPQSAMDLSNNLPFQRHSQWSSLGFSPLPPPAALDSP